jgi:microcystin-dependent protein
MWSGAVNQIPEGWVLCDGSNGTPNLRDRFVVGAGSGYVVGATGGEATHVLAISEMPSHTHIQNPHVHSINDPGHSHSINADNETDTPWPYAGSGNNLDGTINTNSAVTGISINNATAINQNTGGGQAHENRPPFYALAFIMKL